MTFTCYINDLFFSAPLLFFFFREFPEILLSAARYQRIDLGPWVGHRDHDAMTHDLSFMIYVTHLGLDSCSWAKVTTTTTALASKQDLLIFLRTL